MLPFCTNNMYARSSRSETAGLAHKPETKHGTRYQAFHKSADFDSLMAGCRRFVLARHIAACRPVWSDALRRSTAFVGRRCYSDVTVTYFQQAQVFAILGLRYRARAFYSPASWGEDAEIQATPLGSMQLRHSNLRQSAGMRQRARSSAVPCRAHIPVPIANISEGWGKRCRT